jgi:hypothetical protein
MSPWDQYDSRQLEMDCPACGSLVEVTVTLALLAKHEDMEVLDVRTRATHDQRAAGCDFRTSWVVGR